MIAHSDTSATTSTLVAVIDRINEVGPLLAEIADPVDRALRHPRELYRPLVESGLATMLLPEEAGGFGLDFAGYTSALAALARYNGSAALGFNMHNVAIGSIFDADAGSFTGAGASFRDWVISEIVDNGKLFASATSERGNGARLRDLQTCYRRDGDGYRVDGRKSFVSLASVADHYVVSARPADGDELEISHFVLDRDTEGVQFGDHWAGAALHGTSTAEMVIRDAWVPASRLYLGVEGMSLFNVIQQPHWMAAGYLGAYLGLASAIVDFTGYRIENDQRRLRDPLIVSGFGDMVIQLESATALVERATRAVSAGQDDNSRELIYAAKHQLGTTLQSLATRAVNLVGSMSMTASEPMQRLLREAQFCSIMPATSHDCLEYVGRSRLGQNMLDVRYQNW